jgi:hypothetical protein
VSLASLQQRLARAYRALGRLPDAVTLLRAAVGHYDVLAGRPAGGARPSDRAWAQLLLAATLHELAGTKGSYAGAAVAEARAISATLDSAAVTVGVSQRPDDEFAKEYAALRARLATR